MIDFTKRSKCILGTCLTAAMLIVAPVVSTSAHAAGCGAKASQVASSTGGRVLSVQSKGQKCVIKVLVKSGNGPPRRKTVVVSK